MSGAFIRNFLKLCDKYPIIRGCVSFSIICPTGSLLQQTIEGKNLENYDYKRMIRFSAYGVFIAAPLFHSWFRITQLLWPHNTMKSAIQKVLLEQVTFGPFSMGTFFVIMPLWEGKKWAEVEQQFSDKFCQSYKVALCYWPFVQLVNFKMVPQKNRVAFVSIFSLFWWCFLAKMNKARIEENELLIWNNGWIYRIWWHVFWGFNSNQTNLLQLK